MKKKLMLLLCLGLVIGIAQLFLVRNITKQNVEYINTNNPICLALSPECGSCNGVEKDGYCYFPAYTQKFRGFPFTSGSYGYDSRINITPMLIFNILLWTLLLPSMGLIVLKIKHHTPRK